MPAQAKSDAPVDEPGRQLSTARRAVGMQRHFAQSIQPLSIETCVLAIAYLEGWHENETRVGLIAEAARRLKVNA